MFGCLTKTLLSGPFPAVMDNVGCAVGAEQLQFALGNLERIPDQLAGGLFPELRRWGAVLSVQWEAAEGRAFHRQMLT